MEIYVCSSFPDIPSQILIVLSKLPLAVYYPFGEIAKVAIASDWPLKVSIFPLIIILADHCLFHPALHKYYSLQENTGQK